MIPAFPDQFLRIRTVNEINIDNIFGMEDFEEEN